MPLVTSELMVTTTSTKSNSLQSQIQSTQNVQEPAYARLKHRVLTLEKLELQTMQNILFVVSV